MKVLLTGASGFVGSAVLRHLQSQAIPVRPVFRNADSARLAGFAPEQAALVPTLAADTDWSAAGLQGVQVVVHCAARAHVMRETAVDPLLVFRAVNVQGTLNLARQAAMAGVQRFVFISSIGVNGDQTFGKPFSPNDVPNPQGPYAQSKLEAEQVLQRLSTEMGMELVIIRPPLVYGAEAPGSFGRLASAIRSGRWLPLGAVHNCRTLVALDNLVSLITTCIDHPRAAGQVFLAGDAEDISTTDLLRCLGVAMGKPAKLLPVPVKVLLVGARLLGKAALVHKVCGDLQVDIAKNRQLLGWQPPVSLDEGLRRAVQGKL